MEPVKKSIYLDADLDEPLKAAAKAEGRSVTKQINHLLRDGLALGAMREDVSATIEKSFRPYSKEQQLGKAKKLR